MNQNRIPSYAMNETDDTFFLYMQIFLFQLDTDPACYVIDEIGKMELFSTPFKSRIREIFRGSNFVLATIPIRKCDSLIESIRNHVNTKLWIVSISPFYILF